jgi:hypothetical protein
MLSFREFLDAEEKPSVISPTDKDIALPDKQEPEKPFKPSKEQILRHWASVRPNQPIHMAPLPYNYKGATYDKDGVRITGSREFIDSILGRLKDLLFYENPKVKLNLIYRTLYRKGQDPTQPAYAMYAQSEMRGTKKHASPFKTQ